MEIKVSKTVKNPSKEGHPTKIKKLKSKVNKKHFGVLETGLGGAPNQIEDRTKTKNPS